MTVTPAQIAARDQALAHAQARAQEGAAVIVTELTAAPAVCVRSGCGQPAVFAATALYGTPEAQVFTACGADRGDVAREISPST